MRYNIPTIRRTGPALLLCFLFILLGPCLCLADGTATASVSFDGGDQCSTSCPSGTQYVENYACTDGRGNWNGGVGFFYDPIPAGLGYVLHTLNASMYISFCANTTVLVLLEDAVISVLELIANNGTQPSCSCPNCVVSQSFVSNQITPNGLPSYLYNTNNSIEIQLVSEPPVTVCISRVDLSLTYGPVSYNVTALQPLSGTGSGNTNVSVYGNKFFQSAELFCKFDTTRVPAVYVNSTLITCISPPSSIKIYPCNVTVEVSEDGLSYTYDRITFLYLAPPSEYHQLVWVWVAIGICVASVLFVAIAGYFYAQKHKNKGDYTLIDENSRLINSDKYKQYGTVQPVDMSEILIQQRIGRGSCAEVFMGTWRGTTVAIKKAKVFADDDEEFFMELSQEAAIMSELRHPNVLQFLGTASNPPEIVIIMEFMARGSLYRIIHDRTVDLSWPRIRNMALDVARGMNYLHCSDPIIIHRDLKSHNLLVDEHFKVKVCDFGLSTMVKRHLDKFTAMTPVGTPCWTAPEVLRNERYTERADVYSYGVVLWELVTREDPYQGMPTFQIVIAVGQHKMRPLIPPATQPALAQLMVECWSEDPNLRPPFSEIVTRLEKM